MPLVADWDDPSNAIIKVAMIGDWTWKALYDASLQVQNMIERVTEPAKLIVDTRYAVCNPGELTRQLQRLDCELSDEKLAIIVLVSDEDSAFRRIVELLAERGYQLAERTLFVETVDAARARVADWRASGCA